MTAPPQVFVRVVPSGGINTVDGLVEQMNYLTKKRPFLEFNADRQLHVAGEKKPLLFKTCFSEPDVQVKPDEFRDTALAWVKETGVPEGKNRDLTTHLVISFPHDSDREAAENAALEGAKELLQSGRYTADKHKFLYAVHEDKKHLHVHLIVNRRGINGRWLKISNSKEGLPYNTMRKVIAEFALKHGIILDASSRADRGIVARNVTSAEYRRRAAARVKVFDEVEGIVIAGSLPPTPVSSRPGSPQPESRLSDFFESSDVQNELKGVQKSALRKGFLEAFADNARARRLIEEDDLYSAPDDSLISGGSTSGQERRQDALSNRSSDDADQHNPPSPVSEPASPTSQPVSKPALPEPANQPAEAADGSPSPSSVLQKRTQDAAGLKDPSDRSPKRVRLDDNRFNKANSPSPVIEPASLASQPAASPIAPPPVNQPAELVDGSSSSSSVLQKRRSDAAGLEGPSSRSLKRVRLGDDQLNKANSPSPVIEPASLASQPATSPIGPKPANQLAEAADASPSLSSAAQSAQKRRQNNTGLEDLPPSNSVRLDNKRSDKDNPPSPVIEPASPPSQPISTPALPEPARQPAEVVDGSPSSSSVLQKRSQDAAGLKDPSDRSPKRVRLDDDNPPSPVIEPAALSSQPITDPVSPKPDRQPADAANNAHLTSATPEEMREIATPRSEASALERNEPEPPELKRRRRRRELAGKVSRSHIMETRALKKENQRKLRSGKRYDAISTKARRGNDDGHSL